MKYKKVLKKSSPKVQILITESKLTESTKIESKNLDNWFVMPNYQKVKND